MFLGIPQSVATFLPVLFFYIMDFVLIRRYDKERTDNVSGRAWDFTFFIFVLVAILVLQPILIPILSFRTPTAWGLAIQAFGILVILTSLALHAWARIHLKHYYAERVEVQSNHSVINTGPYRHMKHPVITSFFGLAGGLFLINPAITTLAALAYTIWDFTNAARQEENLLSQTIPGYADYARQTPRFLPRLRKN